MLKQLSTKAHRFNHHKIQTNISPHILFQISLKIQCTPVETFSSCDAPVGSKCNSPHFWLEILNKRMLQNSRLRRDHPNSGAKFFSFINDDEFDFISLVKSEMAISGFMLTKICV